MAGVASLEPLGVAEVAAPQPPESPILQRDCARSWLQLEEDGHWIRIHEHDEARIDAALSSGELSAAVFGGRWAAVLDDHQQGQLRPRYEMHLPPKQLRQCRWSFRSWPSNAEWKPFTPEDDQALENLWQRAMAVLSEGGQRPGATPEKKPPAVPSFAMATADGRHCVELKLQPGSDMPIAAMRSTNASWGVSSLVSWYAHRGWAGEQLPPLSEAEVEAEAFEPSALVLVVHGIGEALWSQQHVLASTMGIKSIRAQVDRLRALSAKACKGRRVEFLPVEWHSALRHGEGESSDALSRVTPKTVPSLRNFANLVVLDVLYYEQARHRHLIRAATAGRITELLAAFRRHNPSFRVQHTPSAPHTPAAPSAPAAGGAYAAMAHARPTEAASAEGSFAEAGRVVLMGHSLGSLIVFDLLTAQQLDAAQSPHSTPPTPARTPARTPDTTPGLTSSAADAASSGAPAAPQQPPLDGSPGNAPPASPPSLSSGIHLDFSPAAFVGIGSPVGCFVALRGTTLGPEFKIDKCPRLFNVYHPHDPVAYRMEPLLHEGGEHTPPAYVPWTGVSDGRRLSTRLRETAKEVQQTIASIPDAVKSVKQRVSTITERVASSFAAAFDGAVRTETPAAPEQSAESASAVPYALNGGERVDWVLQETELEATNEYLSALYAHTAYFESDDLVRFLHEQALWP